MVRKFFFALLALLMIGVALRILRSCVRTSDFQTYTVSVEERDEIARFRRDVEEDSVRREQEWQARYEAQQHQWAQERRARYDSLRHNRPLSPEAEAYLRDRAMWDSIRANRPRKLVANETLDLNEVDSAALMQVPLVGEHRAQQILGYRERLGGYTSVEQLMEIKHMSPDVLQWFRVDARATVRKIRINHLDYDDLTHPYLSFKQRGAIANYKRLYGRIKGWDVLMMSPQFTEADRQRLYPYISFD